MEKRVIVGEYYKSRRSGRTVKCLAYGGGVSFHGVVVDSEYNHSFSDKVGYECEYFVVDSFVHCVSKEKNYEDML